MSELENLKRERAKLLAKQEGERERDRYNKEKSKVKSDIFRMKHKKTIRVINIAKRSTSGVGMIFGKVGSALGRGAVNMAQNYEEDNRPIIQRKRSTRKRVVKKRSTKKRVIRKRVVRRDNFPFGNNPFFN